MRRRISLLVFVLALAPNVSLLAQAIDAETPAESIEPDWMTRKQARLFNLLIPAPRGQIVDRNGLPLAQTRISYNLALSFPTPLDFTDQRLLQYARQFIASAEGLLKRKIEVPTELILKHYRNRGVIPLDLVQDLMPAEVEQVRNAVKPGPGLVLRPIYLRFYPNGPVAGSVVGYCGKTGRTADGPLQNQDLLWPEIEGREGIEQSFDEQLKGRPGILTMTFNANGEKTSERISRQPEPGYNVVTTLDLNIQRIAEEALAKGLKRGACVVMEPSTGDILALASWPTYNPNVFIPQVDPEVFRKINEDPNVPLLPRAFRSAYPAGSTFKTFVGLAALESRTIDGNSTFDCPGSFSIGSLTFNNWKASGSGSLNFVDALEQSCNTWFYQVALKTGARNIIDYTHRVGLGMRTGIPLAGEMQGRIPTDEYMMKVHKRRILQGDVCNMAIGQGDILITPLQMAQAMNTIANGGRLLQARLVKQVQTLNNEIFTAYEVRPKQITPIRPEVMDQMRKALVEVVSGGSGTAHRAAVPNVKVGGKTGTAQWGAPPRERTAAWFAGFAPVENPKYSFAALYEGSPNDNSVHGGTHAAPIIGNVLKQLFKEESKKPKEKKKPKKEEEEEIPTPRAVPLDAAPQDDQSN